MTTAETFQLTEDDLEAQHNDQVIRLAASLLREVSDQRGVALSKVLTKLDSARKASPSVVVEAISYLVYAGDLELTDDRRLVVPS